MTEEKEDAKILTPLRAIRAKCWNALQEVRKKSASA